MSAYVGTYLRISIMLCTKQSHMMLLSAHIPSKKHGQTQSWQSVEMLAAGTITVFASQKQQ